MQGQKTKSSLGKNPENYENIWNKTNIPKQKPIIVDDFNEVEEKEVKERVEKRKRWEVAGKKKLWKKKTRVIWGKRKLHMETFKWIKQWV